MFFRDFWPAVAQKQLHIAAGDLDVADLHVLANNSVMDAMFRVDVLLEKLSGQTNHCLVNFRRVFRLSVPPQLTGWVRIHLTYKSIDIFVTNYLLLSAHPGFKDNQNL